MKIIEFINNVTERPPLYKVNKVEDIDLLILGFNSGSEGGAGPFLNEFNIFVQKYYKSKHPWVNLIRLHAGNDADSVNLFKIHFNAYKFKVVASKK